MAASATMQSILVRPVAGARVNRIMPLNHLYTTSLPSFQRRPASLQVCCSSEEIPNEVKNAPSPPPPPPKPKVSTKFSDVLAFSGPAPERINGRLAMVGFVAAIAVELANGQDLFGQISDGAGVPWFVGTSVLLSLASLVPLFKGVTAESKSDGVMTSDAEMWNGRLAMLGLVALALTEYVKGGALV